MNKALLNTLTQRCYAMKLKALDMALGAGAEGCHIGGAFSCMEILATLYEMANIEDMASPNRDRIILSKGHAVLAYYTALWQKGFLTEEQLANIIAAHDRKCAGHSAPAEGLFLVNIQYLNTIYHEE